MEMHDHPTTVLGVWAHPDDETYLSAGLMLRARRAGARVACLTATAGEHGTDDPDAWPPERLARHRAGELRAALDVLGVDDLRLLGLPDGACAAVDDERGAALVGRELEDVRPDLIVTFGPDGITGHPDHQAISRWVTLAWTRLGRPVPLLYATTTPPFARRFKRVHRDLAIFPDGYPVLTSQREVAVEVRLDAWELDRKRDALSAHRSQTEELARLMGEETYRHWWDIESFRTPRPAELAGDPAEPPPVGGLTALFTARPLEVPA